MNNKNTENDKMSRTTKTIILATVVVIICMILYPPWKGFRSEGYQFILEQSFIPSKGYYVHIDIGRLSIQIVFTLFISAGILWVVKKPKQ